jgi:uncharacterized protein YoxC
MITVPMLELRLDGLKKQREQLLANINAVAGAIQMCEELIAEMAKACQPVEPPKGTPELE